MQPSDMRIKEDIVATETSAQLENVKNIKLYTYNLRPEWAEMAGRAESVWKYHVTCNVCLSTCAARRHWSAGTGG